MVLGRYDNIRVTKNRNGINIRASSASISSINKAVRSGQIPVKKTFSQEGDRLDNIAGEEYGNSSLWWIIAAASGIGWCLQVPPGQQILIPTNLKIVKEFL